MGIEYQRVVYPHKSNPNPKVHAAFDGRAICSVLGTQKLQAHTAKEVCGEVTCVRCNNLLRDSEEFAKMPKADQAELYREVSLMIRRFEYLEDAAWYVCMLVIRFLRKVDYDATYGSVANSIVRKLKGDLVRRECGRLVSLEQELTEGFTVGDTLGYVDNRNLNVDLEGFIRGLIAGESNDRTKRVLELYYFDRLTISEIARVIKLSKQRCSQIVMAHNERVQKYYRSVV